MIVQYSAVSDTNRPDEPLTAGKCWCGVWMAGTKQRSIFMVWAGMSAVRTLVGKPFFWPHLRVAIREHLVGCA
jgi:hypothetical protein